MMNLYLIRHRQTVRVLLGLDIRLFRGRVAQSVAGVSPFEMRKSGPLLKLLADVSHLPPALRAAEGT
jgi:hypothetical protein